MEDLWSHNHNHIIIYLLGFFIKLFLLSWVPDSMQLLSCVWNIQKFSLVSNWNANICNNLIGNTFFTISNIYNGMNANLRPICMRFSLQIFYQFVCREKVQTQKTNLWFIFSKGLFRNISNFLHCFYTFFPGKRTSAISFHAHIHWLHFRRK